MGSRASQVGIQSFLKIPSYYMRLNDRLNVIFKNGRFRETPYNIPSVSFDDEGDNRSIIGDQSRVGDLYLLPLTDMEQESLEKVMNGLVEKYFRPVFGEEMGKVLVLISDTDSITADVSIPPPFERRKKYSFFNIAERFRVSQMNEESTSVVVVSRGLIERLHSLDELVGVIGHELFHVLRARLNLESIVNMKFKGMAEEARADAQSVLALGKVGLNPIGVSRLLEMISKESDKLDAKNKSRDSGLTRHPPDEMRISQANALIERLADKQSFPDFTPMPAEILKAVSKRAEPNSFDRIRSGIDRSWTNHYPFFLHLNELAGYMNFASVEWLKKQVGDLSTLYSTSRLPWVDLYISQALPVFKNEMEKYLSQVTPEMIRKFSDENRVSLAGVMQLMAAQFDDLYSSVFSRESSQAVGNFEPKPEPQRHYGRDHPVPPADRVLSFDSDHIRRRLRNHPEVIALFKGYEAKLTALATLLGVPYVTRDQRVQTKLRDFLNVDDLPSFQKWLGNHDHLRRWHPNPGRPVSEFNPKGLGLQSLLPLPYSLASDPTLVHEALNHYFRIAPYLMRDLESKSWDVVSSISVRKARDFYQRILETLSFYPGWESKEAEIEGKIEALRLSPFQKFVLFHPFPDAMARETVVREYTPDHLSPTGFFPKGASKYNWLKTRDAYPKDFPKFHAELSKMESLLTQKWDRDNSKGKTEYYYGTDLFKKVERYEGWISDSLALFSLTKKDVETVLGSNLYWYSKGKAKAEGYQQKLTDLNERINIQLKKGHFDWISADAEERKKEFDDSIEKRFKDRVKKTFYDRPEYKADLHYAQKMQLQLYSTLKRLGNLPQDIQGELDLWKRFAMRGVTDFTDEWAEKIFDHALKEGEAKNIDVVRTIFRSQLVWDLRLRERLARTYYNVKNSAEVAAILGRMGAGWSRKSMIKKLAKEVSYYLPEDSQEKYNVYNFLANTIQTDREETSLFRQKLNVQDSLGQASVGNVKITDDQALGSRVLAELFVELRGSQVDRRLEVLDFLLGNKDEVPLLMDRAKEEWDSIQRDLDAEDAKRIANGGFEMSLPERVTMGMKQFQDRAIGFRLAAGVLGPYRTRRLFQSLDPKIRAVLLDPLLLGSQGLLGDTKGREWVINALVPQGAEWRQLAVDLSDGYIEGLTKLGQSHLKTLFVSFLVASSAKTSYGKYHELLNGTSLSESEAPQKSENVDRQAGRVLRRVFEANAALTKIGQRVHSAYILNEEMNSEIASVKDEASPAGREEYFDWLQDASKCGDICKPVRLLDVKGSASVKVVMGAKIKGKEGVIHLVRPNAVRRGENSFDLIEYALKYALAKGHENLRIVLPIIARAKEAFRKEIDLERERGSIQKMSQAYKPGKVYGEGFQFATPELIAEFDGLVHAKAAEAVVAIPIKKFSELSPDEKLRAASAISEKEAELLIGSQASEASVIHFDKDRHEGNFLFITDPAYLKKAGIPEGQVLILVIDPGQWSEIASSVRETIFHGAALMGAAVFGLGEREVLVTATRDWILSDLVVSSVQPTDIQAAQLKKVVETKLDEAQKKGEVKPGDVLSSILAHTESLGLPVHGEVWDYVTAFGTTQSWDHMLRLGGKGTPFTDKALERVMDKVNCLKILKPAS